MVFLLNGVCILAIFNVLVGNQSTGLSKNKIFVILVALRESG